MVGVAAGLAAVAVAELVAEVEGVSAVVAVSAAEHGVLLRCRVPNSGRKLAGRPAVGMRRSEIART